MCQSVNDGGARCAAHYRPAAKAILDRLESATTQSEQRTLVTEERFPSPFEHAENDEQENAFTLLKNYAATQSGRKEIEKVRDRIKDVASDGTFEERKAKTQSVAYLSNVLKRGSEQKEANKEVRKVIAQKRNRDRDSDRNNAFLTPERVARMRTRTPSATLASEYPYLKEMWREEDNGGAELEIVPAGSSRIQLTLRCPEYPDRHPTWTVRGDAAAAASRTGRRLRCATCARMGLENLQGNLESLRDAMGGDLSAFDSLSPTMQMYLLEQSGALNGGNGIGNSLLMSTVRGELSMSDIVNANGVSDLEGHYSDTLADVDTALETAEVDSLDDLKVEDLDRDTMTEVDRILAASGAAALLPDNALVADRLVNERVEALWNEALGDPDRLDDIRGRLTGQLRNEWEQRVATQFLNELDAAENVELPAGYQGDLTPMLSQKRFMLLAGERRRIGNWSGTGAGKTLSAALTLEHIDAKESLIVAPSDVLPRWRQEFEAGFPDTEVVLVREDAEVSRDIQPVADGKRRVWLVNYEQFSGENGVARIERLTDRVDAVVMDEIHNLKSQSESTASLRHNAAQTFLENASESAISRDKELAVIGMSATPIINDLDEAKSIFRLISGRAPGIGTKPTVANIAKFHHRMRALGVRQRPQLSHKIRRNTVEVDITDSSYNIVTDLEGRKNASSSGRLHGAQVEQALLPYKMPAVKAAVESSTSKGEPVVVYSNYVEGMIDPIVTDVSTMKRPDGSPLRVVRYTGSESPQERSDIVRRFRAGQIDVLVASDPIATGVDGLQDVCSHMVVVSPPYTPAKLEQLEGRVYRTGLNSDVRIDYIATSAKKTDQVKAWSWCASRLRAIRSKRSLADAVMDGTVPETLSRAAKGMRGKALAGIGTLVESVDLAGGED